MLEKDIERKLRLAVKALGGECLKWVSPAHSGVPDRIVLLNGKVYFVELKRTPYSNISPLQIAFGKWLIDNGFDYSILMSIYDVEFFIKRLEHENKFT